MGEDIEIEFTGLRPGEKLFEELLANTEKTLPTSHERVRVAQVRPISESLNDKVTNLLQSLDAMEIRNKIKEIVPEYNIPEYATEIS